MLIKKPRRFQTALSTSPAPPPPPRDVGFKATHPLGESKSVTAESTTWKKRDGVGGSFERRRWTSWRKTGPPLPARYRSAFTLRWLSTYLDINKLIKKKRPRSDNPRPPDPSAPSVCHPWQDSGRELPTRDQKRCPVSVRPRGTKPTIVLQIAPTGNPDNALRLVPIVVVFSPCEREAGFFSLFFFVKCPGVHGVITALRCVRLCSRSLYPFLRHDSRPK